MTMQFVNPIFLLNEYKKRSANKHQQCKQRTFLHTYLSRIPSAELCNVTLIHCISTVITSWEKLENEKHSSALRIHLHKLLLFLLPKTHFELQQGTHDCHGQLKRTIDIRQQHSQDTMYYSRVHRYNVLHQTESTSCNSLHSIPEEKTKQKVRFSILSEFFCFTIFSTTNYYVPADKRFVSTDDLKLSAGRSLCNTQILKGKQ